MDIGDHSGWQLESLWNNPNLVSAGDWVRAQNTAFALERIGQLATGKSSGSSVSQAPGG
jgi:hypothetical protein